MALLIALIALAGGGLVRAAAPIAPHLMLTVAKNGMVEIALQGTDVDGDKLKAYVFDLPAVGTLYQLSQVYSDYGYEPKLGDPITTADLPALVTGSASRIIYVPPANVNEPIDRWSTFNYAVHDGTSQSERGIVWLLPPHRRVVHSDFAKDTDGWAIVDNGRAASALPAGGLAWEPYSRGQLSQYILATDAEIHEDPETGNDRTQWRLVAPAKFHGNHVAAYGGSFEFSVASLAGDYDKPNTDTMYHVVLECSSCSSGTGVRLGAIAKELALLGDGASRRVSIPLQAKLWREDSKNYVLPWTVPSDCTLVEVLSGLTGITISGDTTQWFESVALDDIGFVSGSGVPLKCADVYY